jgi:hypothetical protein
VESAAVEEGGVKAPTYATFAALLALTCAGRAWGAVVICDPNGRPELCSGGAVISGPMKPDSVGVIAFKVTPDGARAVFVADPERRTLFQLYSVKPTGGAVARLNAPLPHGLPFSDFDVDDRTFLFAGNRVVYRVVRVALGIADLWSAPIDGGSAVRLSPVYPPGGAVERFEVLSDGRVRFSANANALSYAWYRVAATGGRVYQEIFFDGFDMGSSERWR